MTKPFKETKLYKFLSEKAPKVLNVIGDVLPDKGVLGIVKNLIDSDPDIPAEDKLEFQKLLQDHEKEMYALEIDDRKDARDLYKSDNQLQKIFAITFLIGYILLTIAAGVMVWVIAKDSIHIPEWAIGFVGTIWGGMSGKVSTITDFLFGSSFRQEPQTTLFKK
jgi:hypothetical protein